MLTFCENWEAEKWKVCCYTLLIIMQYNRLQQTNELNVFIYLIMRWSGEGKLSSIFFVLFISTCYCYRVFMKMPRKCSENSTATQYVHAITRVHFFSFVILIIVHRHRRLSPHQLTCHVFFFLVTSHSLSATTKKNAIKVKQFFLHFQTSNEGKQLATNTKFEKL